MEAAELEHIRRDLAAIVGARHVSVRGSIRSIYGRDSWTKSFLVARRGEDRYPPDVVVWPGSTDDVARIVTWARSRHLPITAFGAGSSMTGAATPVRAGISLDLKRLRRVISLDPVGRRVTAQAGILGTALEEELGRSQLTVGHLPSSLGISTLGGWIATRAAGQLTTRYGKIEDVLLGVTAVAGTGEVLRVGPDRRPGPDLLQLLAGSEGTLAIVTDATLGLQPLPHAKAMRAFRMRSFDAGLTALRLVLRAGLRPHLLRLYDPVATQLQGSRGFAQASDVVSTPVRAVLQSLKSRSLGYALSVPSVLNRTADLLPPRSLLLVSFEGEAQAQVEEELAAVRDLVRDAGGSDLGEGPVRRWYRRRYSSSFGQSAVFSGGAWADTLDVAVTWDRAERVWEAVRRAAWHDAVVFAQIAHVYLEGCSLAFTLAGPATNLARVESSYEHTCRKVLAAALEAGATLSHHSGIGASRARLLPDELGDSGMRLLRALKATFDPDGILNPGKLVA